MINTALGIMLGAWVIGYYAPSPFNQCLLMFCIALEIVGAFMKSNK